MTESGEHNATGYRKRQALGSGAFSEVFLVEKIGSAEQLVLKEVLLTGLDESTILQLFTEAKILEALNHPHIIAIKEFYRTESQKLVFILEFASKGDLHDWVGKLDQPLAENLARSLLIRVDPSALSGSKVRS